MGILAVRMKRLAFILAAALALGGCSFSRTVINRNVQWTDTSWIVPGKTTRAEVIERIGYPEMVPEAGINGIADTHFRYSCKDMYERAFLGKVVSRTQGGYSYDVLIVFDEQGVVNLISRSTKEAGKVRVIEHREYRK